MKKIVLIGPECTGKTTLARALADRLGGVYVPEYSRPYSIRVRSEQGRNLTLDDVMPIVRGQIAAEAGAAAQNPDYIFIDSNPLASAVYSMWYYGREPEGLDGIVSSMKYDMYLLCAPDIEWEDDPARDMPVGREGIFAMFEEALAVRMLPFAVISGEGDERFENAIAALAGRVLPAERK